MELLLTKRTKPVTSVSVAVEPPIDRSIQDPTNYLNDMLSYFYGPEVMQNIEAEMQKIQFCDEFPVGDYRLMEVTKEVAESVAVGEKLVFRGRDEDAVVLCTESETYSVKEIETSNTLLVLPTLRTPTDVIDSDTKLLKRAPITILCQKYLESRRMSLVSAALLRQMLQMTELPWDWPRSNANETNTYTLKEIQSCMQMSDKELSCVMEKMPVVEHCGKIRWLSYDIQDRVLDLIVEAFDNVEMTSINLSHLTPQALRSFLPENVTDAVIGWFLRTMCKKTENGDYDVDPDTFSCARAAQLLRSAPRFEIYDFHKRADALMPFAISGISVQYGNASANYISYLSIDELPDNPRDRLRIMFSKQNQWKLEEMMAFFPDIYGNSRDLGLLLMDMCNSIELKDGTIVYCSVRPI
uniref:Sister chromatid cohesion protein DCC1 n=1 Tax=Angiostrongylus cantonensis TaxID=6313 RepID=A0A0K0D3Z0_ANGCA